MAHYRRTIGAATLVNTAITVGEGCTAFWSGSLSVLVDSVHNLSDELALVLRATVGSRRPYEVLSGYTLLYWKRDTALPSIAST